MEREKQKVAEQERIAKAKEEAKLAKQKAEREEEEAILAAGGQLSPSRLRRSRFVSTCTICTIDFTTF